MSDSNYKKLAAKGSINVIRPGKGLGHYALVELATMPQRFQEKIKEKYGDMNADIMRLWIGSHYRVDSEARKHYAKFKFEDGSTLSAEHIDEYTINASAIKAVLSLMSDTTMRRKAMKGKPLNWNELAGAINYYKEEFGHTLPTSVNRFKKKVNDFKEKGYDSLISGKYKNQNRRKVSYRIESLIQGLKAMTEHPYDTVVAEMYNQFVTGDLEVYDPATGEVFDPAEFRDKKGNPTVLSKSTIALYLNKPVTAVSLSKVHQDQWSFNNSQRPYHLRYKGNYSGSMISLDDRDLPRKMHDGNRVKMYGAFDVLSEAIIGYSFNRKKNDALYLDCIRSMVRTLRNLGLKRPGEAQVEHHLVKDFADTVMKEGVVFDMVQWCNPGNSREKHAERNNRNLRYETGKQLYAGTGRWYAKLDEHKTKIKKAFDEDNDNYIEKTYSYDELVADEIEAVITYNNAPHPNQKRFPGLTRWDVFKQFQNPDLQDWDDVTVSRYVGEHVKTTIRQNAYVTVQYNQYRLSSPEIIRLLAPRNYKVDAYYWPDRDGNIDEVYIYQNGRLIDCCKKVVRYNTATIEQTEADKAAYLDQSKYLSKFDAMVKENKISKVGVLKKEVAAEIMESEAAEVRIEQPEADDDYSEYMDITRIEAEAVDSIK